MQTNVSHYKTLNRQDIFNALLYLRLHISNMQTSTVCFSFICWAPNGFLFEKIKFSVNCRSHSFLGIRNYASYTGHMVSLSPWYIILAQYLHEILMSINILTQYKYKYQLKVFSILSSKIVSLLHNSYCMYIAFWII